MINAVRSRAAINGSRLSLIIVPAAIITILLVMAIVEPHFYGRLNLLDIARNYAFISIAAIGQALVMIVGGFDLSVGAVIALASVTCAKAMTFASAVMPDAPALAAVIGVLAALSVGGLVGLVNGLLVSVLKITPFMATLATMTIVLGIVFFWSNGIPIYGMPKEFTVDFARLQIFRVPLMVWVAIVILAVAWFIMQQAPLGRHVYAVGGNLQAAMAAGINHNRVLVLTYVVSGICAATVGVLLTARIGSGQADLAGNAAIQSIAAAVIGGVSLRGGSGKVLRVAMGALFLALIGNALNLARVDSKLQTLVIGFAILIAVAVEARATKKN